MSLDFKLQKSELERSVRASQIMEGTHMPPFRAPSQRGLMTSLVPFHSSPATLNTQHQPNNMGLRTHTDPDEVW